MISEILSNSTIAASVAFVAYLIAHGLRTLRFWLINGESSLSLRRVFLIFYTTAVLGFFVPLVLSELIRLALLIYYGRDGVRITFTYAISRLLDILFLGTASWFLMGASGSQAVSNLSIALIVVALFGLLIVLTAPKTFIPIQEILLRRLNNEFGVRLMKIASSIAKYSQPSFASKTSPLGIAFLMTVAIWILDVLALQCLFPNENFGTLMTGWIAWGLRGIFGFGNFNLPISAEHLNFNQQIQSSLLYPQVAFAVLLLLSVILACLHRTKNINMTRKTAGLR